MTFDKSLRAAAHRLAQQSVGEAVPVRFRAEVLARLPEGRPQETAPAFPISQRAIGAFAVASLVGIGGTTWYRSLSQKSHSLRINSHSTPINAQKFDPTLALRGKADEAVHRVDSWHFSGRNYTNEPDDSFAAHLSTTKATAQWEIWGRRKPAFYREQQGDELLVIDGDKRIQFAPASKAAAGAKTGTQSQLPPIDRPSVEVIEQFSGQAAPSTPIDASDNFEHAFAGIAKPATAAGLSSPAVAVTDRLAAFTTYSLTPAAPGHESDVIKKDVNNENFRLKEELSVDRMTSLPTHFTSIETIYPTKPSEGTIHQGKVIEASYNKPISKDLAIVKPAANALVVNIVPNGEAKTTIGRKPATIRGLAVRLEVVETNADGDIFYVPHWSVGSEPISLAVLGQMLRFSISELTLTDDSGRRFLAIGDFGAVDSGQKLAVIAPIEPRAIGAPAPRRLKTEFNIDFTGLSGGRIASSTTYVTSITMSTDLPMRSGGLSGNSLHISALTEPDLKLRILKARSNYYLLGAGQGGPAPLHDDAPADHTDASPADGPVALTLQGATLRHMAQPALTPQDYARATYWTNQLIDEATRDGKLGIARQFAWRLKSLAPP